MVDKITFMETLHLVQEIARTSAEPMTKDEIQVYFKDMDLSGEQRELIYQYLQHPDEEQTGETNEKTENGGNARSESRKGGGSKNKGSSIKSTATSHFQMYLDEMKKIPVLSKEQECILYEKLLSGEEDVIPDISKQWLRKIAEIAESYVTDRVLIEDLVQEGNMGLLVGMQQILEESNAEELSGGSIDNGKELHRSVEKRLETFVREAIERYREETEGEHNSAHTILAKINLIHEAQKVLAEENGTVPTLAELSEYTRISEQEIKEILALSKTDIT